MPPAAPLRASHTTEPAVVALARRDAAAALAELQSTPRGLTRLQSATRRARIGPNAIAREKPVPWWWQLLHAFHTPFNYLLLVLAAIDLATADYKGATVITFMVLVSCLLRFVQEFRSGRAAAALRALVQSTATAVRPDGDAGERLETVPVADLTPGDVVHLSAGDLVPADVRLLTAKDLFVAQSALTGEAMPVEKHDCPGDDAARRLAGRVSPLELPSLAFLGSTVVSGSARAVVCLTGERTYLGSLAGALAGQRGPTAFDKGVNAVSWLLIRFMFAMVPVIVLLNGLTKGDWGEAALFGVSIAVGLTPEMLPMIVTANLARGALAMSKRQVIVKALPAIQNLGAMDVLCTDKTGTLTQDKVVLLKHLDPAGRECETTYEYAFLNSHFQTGLKNLLDVAVLEYGPAEQTRALAAKYVKSDEVPFDFARRRMSVIVHEVFRGRDLLICKGAVEEVLAACTHLRRGDADTPLDEAVKAQAVALRTDLNEDGLRVIAVAVKQVPSSPGKQYGAADETDLSLVGYVAFLDPPKETAGPALAALASHGVAVKILTGDNDLVSRKVCRDVGLPDPPTLLGPDLDDMDEATLGKAAERTVLFAKLSPPQKARVIAALKRAGHTVGFLGDGINDAPALREADVGISVDTGADIARESADIILLKKSLLVLEEGVLIGRQTYANTVKYLKMAASSNFGNVLSVLVASVWLPFLPMLPLHLLIQNFLYDLSQAGIPFDHGDAEDVQKPRPWRVADLGRFMLLVGPTSSVFDLLTFALMYWGFAANTPARQSLFQTGWFVEGLLSQTLIIHLIRTAKVPFVQSTAAAPLLVLSLLVAGAGVLLPFTPLAEAVEMVPLPASYFPWLAGLLLGYCALAQLVKGMYIRRFGEWL